MYRGGVGACPHTPCPVPFGMRGRAGSGSDSDGERRIGILGAGSDSGGPHGPRGGRDRIRWGRIGLGGLDPPTGASPASLKPVCYRGTRGCCASSVAPSGGGSTGNHGSQKSPKRKNAHPVRPPARGDFGQGGAAGPSRPASYDAGSRRPFKTRQVRPGLPLASRSVHSGVLNPRCTVRGKGDGQISPLCLTNTADSHLGVHVHVMSA